jgi:hypothetical protein
MAVKKQPVPINFKNEFQDASVPIKVQVPINIKNGF